jgi:hypothetical protein
MSASKKYGVRMPAARVGVCISAVELNMPLNAAVSTFLHLMRAGGTKQHGGKENGGKENGGAPPIRHGRTLVSG